MCAIAWHISITGMPDAFFYPFHLCSPDTLERVLSRYDTVHFRDYMALQLTPTSGTTAFPDRMGDLHPEFLKQERIVQGYRVSGPLSPEMDRRIDHDFKDRTWREIFHFALRNDARFQRGMAPEGTNFGPWLPNRWMEWQITLAEVRQMSMLKLDPERAIFLEYGLMLVKTSAALWYTIQICQQHAFEAVTDSISHARLLQHVTARDHIALPTFLLRE